MHNSKFGSMKKLSREEMKTLKGGYTWDQAHCIAGAWSFSTCAQYFGHKSDCEVPCSFDYCCHQAGVPGFDCYTNGCIS